MKAIILSITSDIGRILAKKLGESGYEVFGTYNRTLPSEEYQNIDTFKLNIKEYNSLEYNNWLEAIGEWDLFVSCIGTQEPVGRFTDIDLDKWVEGIAENSTYQIAALINALKYKSRKNIANVIFFAGGGTNSATPCYSAQTLGKISLIKSIELLDHEISDVKFSILGPGWVKTKIHNATLNKKEESGENYYKTAEMMKSKKNFNSIEKVVEDIFKIISLPKELVGGRNFSSVHDQITAQNLKKLKNIDIDFYKLRRKLN